LPGYDRPETTALLHKKDKFRELCRKHGFATPRSVSSPSQASALTFPIMVKPSDSFSGRGIIKVDHPGELESAIEYSKVLRGSESIVIEEFIEGNLYSHSAFLRDGKIAVDFFVNEFCTVHPYQVNSSHLCVELDGKVVRGLREWLESFATTLELTDGLVHTQFVSSGGSFYLIEVMRRCPGDLYALLIAKSTGVPYAQLYASAFCGLAVARIENPRVSKFFSRHTVSVPQECVFLSSRIELRNASISFVPLKKTGETLRAVPMDRAGIYFIEHSTAKEMAEITPKLKNYVAVETLENV